ncbi:polysaccharide deacetylase family protein [Metaclostridioides mangenotii]|uniref:polysaccharide deacetylase family protein n=1 Tax=Metaclostridioides mangenotii TaxID=1540 RepID=UPI0028E3E5CF|nr:polysaccharide deacetylase family protein [Clostridioides mangenotii]
MEVIICTMAKTSINSKIFEGTLVIMKKLKISIEPLKKSFKSSVIIVLGILLSMSLYACDKNGAKETVKMTQADNIVIDHGSREKKVVALTFDDGPHPKETDQVLDVLKENDIKGTFFIAGKHAEWYKKPLIRASKEGHEIGNHTFNHHDISTLSSEQLEEEILKCEEAIKSVTGKKTKLFRPPFGSYRKNNLVEIAEKNGYKIVLWTGFDAKDWKNPSAEDIADNIYKNVKNGDIILLHDYGTPNTVEALKIIIPKMKKDGYRFTTVSELIK